MQSVIYSVKIMSYQPRLLESEIKKYMKLFPVVGITGPRQSGKSTLLQNMFPNFQYVSFDDPLLVGFLKEDPEKFLQTYSAHIIFDEVQKVPQLFPLIKMVVDKHRQDYGRFVLTGSSQFSLIAHITESLAGRIGLLSLLPFQQLELPTGIATDVLWGGSYPELVMRDYQGKTAWYSSYLETYLHRDVRSLAQVGDLNDFQHLLRLLAVHVAQQVNFSQLATEVGVSVQTVRRWIGILEMSYIIFLLPPYYKNLGKRLSKRPKVYFWDNGLVTYLLGIRDQQQFDHHPMMGALFENYIVSDIAKNKKHCNVDAELFYLRTQHGAEVDLVVDYKTHCEWIEIKSTASFRPKLVKTLEEYKEKNDGAWLLYQGKPTPYSGVRVMHYLDYLCGKGVDL